MSRNVLLVDDEKQILKALYRLFMESDYRVFLAESGKEALEILEQEKMDIIISDMRMPEMDGYQLLKIAKEKCPSVIRVMLSGFSDESTLFKALKNNIVKLYIFKPWDNAELLNIIANIFKVEDELRKLNIFDIVNQIEDLPTINGLYNRLSELIEQDASIEEITEIISRDQSISSRILRIANSAYYGVKTGDIKQAILFLGLSNLKNVILSTAIFDSVKSKNVHPYSESLWKHAVLTNRIASLIYKEFLNKKIPSDYSAAGLLHDIGKIIILNNYTEKYKQVISRVQNEKNLSDFDIEKELLGFSHEEVGGYLLNWWELPYAIVESAMFHHKPFDERIIHKELVMVIYMADYYSWKILNGNRADNVNIKVFDFLKVDQAAFEKSIESHKASFAEGE